MFTKVIKAIPGTIGLIASIITIYLLFFQDDKIKLEVTSDTCELTKLPKITGLDVSFKYNDSIVTNLWSVKFGIKNQGYKTLVGMGDKKDLVTDSLKIYLQDSLNILSINKQNENFPSQMIITDSNYVYLLFKQWRNNEYVEFICFCEYFGTKTPTVFIDDRDIIKSSISYSTLVSKNEKKRLIDYFPFGIKQFLKWTITLMIILVSIKSVFSIRKGLKSGTNKEPISITAKIVAIFLWILITLITATPLLWIIQL